MVLVAALPLAGLVLWLALSVDVARILAEYGLPMRRPHHPRRHLPPPGAAIPREEPLSRAHLLAAARAFRRAE